MSGRPSPSASRTTRAPVARRAKPVGFRAIPSATGGIARLACARLRSHGCSDAAVLSQVGLTTKEAADPAIRLDVQAQIRILQLAAETLRDDWLGFRLARDFDLREIGLVYYVMASSDDLADALRNASRYSQIMNEGVRLRFEERGRSATLAIDYVDVDRQSDRHQIEFWLVTLVRLCRQVTATRIAPTRLKLRHVRRDAPAELKRFFGTDIEFGADADEIILSSTMISLPLAGRDGRLNDLLRRYAEEALADKAPRRTTLRAKVEAILPELLPHGKAVASEVGRRLAVSSRTLSRKLAEEDVSFGEILEETRTALAKRYLEDDALPVSNIAWLLGYRELGSFTHAFRRWTGTTPREYRSAGKAHTNARRRGRQADA